MSDPITGKVEYRDIEGFPGYRIGDDGSVLTCIKWGALERTYLDTWRKRKTCSDIDGYQVITLTMENKKQVTRKVHRLVLEAFVGQAPPGTICCHENANRSDNRLVNLRWGTPSENEADRKRHGNVCAPKGGMHFNARLNEENVKEILSMRGKNQQYIADRFAVSHETIRLILARKTWKHVPDQHAVNERTSVEGLSVGVAE
jgi:hypothetical protein